MDLEKKSSTLLKYEISERDTSDAMIGDVTLDERSKERIEFPFEHRDLHQSNLFSSDMQNSQSNKVEIVQLKSYEKDDVKNPLAERANKETCFTQQKEVLFQQSEMFVPDYEKLSLTEKKEEVNSSETTECLYKNKEEKSSRSIFAVKGILTKMIIWSFDEKLYTGVMHNGSFINRLSKALTG